VLEATSENLRHELYKTEENGDFAFTGVINHSIAIQAAEKATAGVDVALETLKNSMATLYQEKEARQYVLLNPSNLF
jgi:RNA polymerase II elongation factor ELL